MRQLLILATFFLVQGCIEAPPATQLPTDQDQDQANDMSVSDMGSVDFGESDGGETDSDMTTEDMSADMAEDMPAQRPFVVTIAPNSLNFEVTQPLFGSIQDERLRGMRNVRLASNLPVETSPKRDDLIGFWIRIPTPTHTAEVTVTEEPHIDTLMWQNYHHVFHMDGTQNARRSSSSLANITGMSSAIGQVGTGARGIGGTDFDWSSGEEFTIMFWFRDITNEGSEQLIRFSPTNAAVDEGDYSFALEQGSPVFRYGEGTMSVPAYQADAEFHHVALVYPGEAQSFEFYVDGELIGRGTSATSLLGTYQIDIGDSSASDNVFDEFWIEKSALTAQEIETIYRNQLGEITISN